MINKCKVQIRMKDLYNVVEPLREGDEKCIICTQKIESSVRHPFLCFCFCNDVVHASDRLSSLRLSSLTHPLQRFIVCCALGQGLIIRIWTGKIVQLQTLIRVIKKNKNSPKESRERESTHSFVWEKYGLNGKMISNLYKIKLVEEEPKYKKE